LSMGGFKQEGSLPELRACDSLVTANQKRRGARKVNIKMGAQRSMETALVKSRFVEMQLEGEERK